MVEDDVSLNTLSPVLNLGFPLVFGFGILNTPDTKPLADVTRLPPDEPPVGVTNAVPFCLSKNGYTLVRGFIPVAENDTFFARMKGISALDITLSPCDSLSIRGTTLVFTPCLVRLVVVVVVVL